jgi:hypothetical protein
LRAEFIGDMSFGSRNKFGHALLTASDANPSPSGPPIRTEKPRQMVQLPVTSGLLPPSGSIHRLSELAHRTSHSAVVLKVARGRPIAIGLNLTERQRGHWTDVRIASAATLRC